MSRNRSQEAASRHIPVAHQRTASERKRGIAPVTDGTGIDVKRTPSETRLQAGVACPHPRDERDPYADVPCTD